MLVVMRPEATQEEIDHVVQALSEAGAEAHISRGEFRVVIGAIGDAETVGSLPLEALPGVERAVAVTKPYKLVSLEFRSERSRVRIGPVSVGPGTMTLIAGPATLHSEEQAIASARAARDGGASVFCGGSVGSPASPYSFQGLGKGGLEILRSVKEESGLPVVVEVSDPRDLEAVAEVADCVMIGEDSMQDFLLLREAGLQRRPVILKRGESNVVEELLLSAEYIAKGGNDQIILCESGIRTFETSTRSTLDISAVPILRAASHLPVIVDPSHAAGRADLVPALAAGAVAAGCDGVIVSAYPSGSGGFAEGLLAVGAEELLALGKTLSAVREAVGASAGR